MRFVRPLRPFETETTEVEAAAGEGAAEAAAADAIRLACKLLITGCFKIISFV